MATISQSHASGALTPPRSPEAGQRPWDLPGTKNQDLRTASNSQVDYNNSSASRPDYSQRYPLSHQTNGSALNQRPSRSELSQRGADYSDSTFLQPKQVAALAHKGSNISRTGSEPDSLLDLYGSNSANRSGVSSMDYGERKAPNGNGYSNSEDDPESSRWIHRDKLARIESRELQEAGIHIGRESRSASRQTGRKDRPPFELQDGSNDANSAGAREDKRRRLASPIVMDETEEAPMTFDLRLPEEAASDPYEENRQLRGPTAKQSYSRIPLSTSSPIPVPVDYLARATPLQRNESNGWGEDEGIPYGKTRSRSHSVGSQVLLDDEDTSSPTPGGSPSKARIAKNGTASGNRKVSGTRNTSNIQKPRTRSGTKSPSRPPTRSGETPPGSGSSSRRPEGDPPWLAHMYKPDPRLPPDQQLIPTHAKRLQQEQWEREGKLGSAYDRDFHPLDLHEEMDPSIRRQDVDEPELKQGDPEWPLKSPRSPALSNGRPGTSGTDHGGYNIMPAIQKAPPGAPTPKSPMQPIRLGEPEEEEKKKGGCLCCIVM